MFILCLKLLSQKTHILIICSIYPVFGSPSETMFNLIHVPKLKQQVIYDYFKYVYSQLFDIKH